MQLRNKHQTNRGGSISNTSLDSNCNFKRNAGNAGAGISLTTLNDDCLLLICVQLSIKDQFALLQLGNGRLQQLVLQLWQRKYANEFDWQREPQLKLLSGVEQRQLLGYMAKISKALLNLSLLAWPRRKRKWQRKWCNIQRLSFMASNSMLGQLQLGSYLGTLFAQLPHLSVFELLPGDGGGAGDCEGRGVGAGGNFRCCAAASADFNYCQTLKTLKLPACMLRATAANIARLPQLQQLTGFLCCSSSSNMNDDSGATATISAWLAALSDVTCQIVALNLQCQLDGSLPRLLAGHLRLLRLYRFAWHSQLMVHYDATDGSIKWLPQQPQVARAILNFIVSQAASLHELDFMRNVHATPTFLTHLSEQLLLHRHQEEADAEAPPPPPFALSVWHDQCPRPGMSNAKMDTNGTNTSHNDLPFVEFEIKHLSNAKMNCSYA